MQGLLNIAMLDAAEQQLIRRRVNTRAERSATKGTMILMVFFILFTAASLLISSSMFPGNVLCTLIGASVSQYTAIASALFNGVLYSVALWLIFIAVSRKLAQEK
jgi:hypothetical protein